MKNNRLGKKGYNRYESKAGDYLNDSEKATKLLEDARKKADKKHGKLDEIWDKVQLFFSIFDDWIKGNYKAISNKSIVMIIVGIVYFVIPTDLFPDFIVGFGLIDDISVLGFVINQISNDLNAYKIWKQSNHDVTNQSEQLSDLAVVKSPNKDIDQNTKLKVEKQGSNEGVRFIEDMLAQYNDASSPKSTKTKRIIVNFLLKDKNGNIYGGINGMIYRSCMTIEHLWVSDDVRGMGHGTKLLKAAEKMARREKCRFVHLDTFNFQAPEFYKSNGYDVFGLIDTYPDDIKRYYLKKNL